MLSFYLTLVVYSILFIFYLYYLVWYVKKGEDVIWLKKNEFEDNYEFLFGDNPDFLKKYPYKSIKWEHLSYLIYQYTKMSS